MCLDVCAHCVVLHCLLSGMGGGEVGRPTLQQHMKCVLCEGATSDVLRLCGMPVLCVDGVREEGSAPILDLEGGVGGGGSVFWAK